MLEALVQVLNHAVWSFPPALPWLVLLLLGTGLFVTVRLGFIQLRRMPHGFSVLAGRYDDPEHQGDVTHFQALSTALSATVGIGNIAGVATAIHYGGPGALFWMWLTAGFGMALKYAECTLSLLYRDFDAQGGAAGGPMYYIERGLGPRFKPLAIAFATCTVIASFGIGNMNQANTVAISARSDFGLSETWVGVVLAVVVGGVIVGGIRRIAKVSSKLAPAMAALYVGAALVILALRFEAIPAAFVTIIRDAFSPKASLGGSVAGVFATTLLWGVKRGLFSNEAGMGSAPIAHAAARTNEPVREGVVAMLGPFIDTLIICTLTGLVIVTTGAWEQKTSSRVKVAHTQVLWAEALTHAQGTSEAARLQQALAHDPPKAEEQVQVKNGHQNLWAFVARQSLVGTPVLWLHNKPYTGWVAFRGGTLEPAEEEGTLMVEGHMLQNSSALTALAFQVGLSPLGNWGNYVVTVAVLLFALSTMISWSYYGDRAITYLCGARMVLPYRALYTGFVFIGSVSALELVWAFGDLALGLMATPNLLAVVLLMPKILEATRNYFQRMDEA